ncbi:MAG: hypothetical protein ACLGPM_04840 [Acidobacteriota bacterium]
MLRILRSWPSTAPVAALLLVLAAGCSQNNAASSATANFAVALGSSSVAVPQDGTPATLAVTITGASGTPAVAVSGLPAGVTQQFTPVAGGPSGTLSFIGNTTVPAGNYPVSVTVTAGSRVQSQAFTLVSAVVASIKPSVDTSLGIQGNLQQFMSTSFQISGYTGNFFASAASTKQSELTALAPQHIRLQAIGAALPMTGDTATAADWNFTLLDQIVQPVLSTADQSPEFQIATAPAWMCHPDGTFDIADHLHDFAAYAANLVRYYNAGGFNWGGQHFQSPGAQHITWWGIFNEPNLNGLTAAQYATLYNTVVPAMLAVDPSLKFSALEFSDYGLGTGQMGDPEQYLPAFLAPAASGGVNAQIDSISTHLYGGCNQRDTDAALFAAVPGFAANIQYFYQELATRADLASVPVWVTENNVNADFAGSSGMSSCNPTQLFVNDPRGSDAFFAAWRPYVFSQLGKAANRALYQWMFTGSTQYGETDANGTPYLSYWVDRSLENAFPAPPAGTPPQILTTSLTDSDSLEVLAVKNASGVVTLMVVNHAVQATTDDNGAGAPRTVVVDLSRFNLFGAASLKTVDASTNLTTGPVSTAITPSSRITLTFNGYGTAFLTLTP